MYMYLWYFLESGMMQLSGRRRVRGGKGIGMSGISSITYYYYMYTLYSDMDDDRR